MPLGATQSVELVQEPTEKVELFRTAGTLYLERSSNQAEAIKCFEQLLEYDATDTDAIGRLKQMYEKRRDWEKLIRAMQREVELLPADEQMARYAEMADLATQRLRKPDVCIELWQKVLEGDPVHSGRFDVGGFGVRTMAGVWQCTPGKFEYTYPGDEICTLIEGHISLVCEDGKTHEYFHPFEQQRLGAGLDLSTLWHLSGRSGQERYDEGVSLSAELIAHRHTPKTANSRPYQGVVPYGYHIDATLLARSPFVASAARNTAVITSTMVGAGALSMKKLA